MTNLYFECAKCGKRFKKHGHARNHDRQKHVGSPNIIKWAPPDDDESFAERAIQSEIDIASGLGSDDEWLLP